MHWPISMDGQMRGVCCSKASSGRRRFCGFRGSAWTGVLLLQHAHELHLGGPRMRVFTSIFNLKLSAFLRPFLPKYKFLKITKTCKLCPYDKFHTFYRYKTSGFSIHIHNCSSLDAQHFPSYLSISVPILSVDYVAENSHSIDFVQA